MSVERVTVIDDKLHDQIVAIGDEFYAEARIPGKFNAHIFLNTWHHILKMNLGAMWKFTQGDKLLGMLGAMISADLCDGEIIAQEAFWFVSKSARGMSGGMRLYCEFMEWAKKVGVKRVLITHLLTSMPDKLENFYRREGFRPVETTYLKEIA